MDESKIRAIVDEHIPRLLWELQLNMWTVSVEITELDGLDASVSVRHEYEHATITINPKRAQTEEDVLHSLRHELFHLFHADYEIIRNTLTATLDDEHWATLNTLLSYAAEKTVLRLERAFDHGLKIPLLPDQEKA